MMADVRINFCGMNLDRVRADMAALPSVLTKRDAAAVRRAMAVLHALEVKHGRQ